MRAQVLEALHKPYQLRERPRPSHPQGHDLLIKVEAASYCHTDAVLQSGNRGSTLPLVGSHEISGLVVELGPDVDSSLGFKRGTLVGVSTRTYHPCGVCPDCQNPDDDTVGVSVYCIQGKSIGLDLDGGFQDYCLVDSRQCVPVPAGLSAIDTAPLMCAGLTVWNCIERAGASMVKNGDADRTIAIAGAGGGLGHLGVQFAARLGYKVVAIEIGDRPLKLLRKVVDGLGSDGKNVTIVDAGKQDAEAARANINKKTNQGIRWDKGVDASIVLPESQEAFDFAMALLNRHGTCIVASFPKEGFRLNGKDLIFRDLKVVGVLCGRIQQARDMLDFTAKHGVKTESRIYPLEKLNQLVEDYRGGIGGKLIVDLNMGRGSANPSPGMHDSVL